MRHNLYLHLIHQKNITSPPRPQSERLDEAEKVPSAAFLPAKSALYSSSLGSFQQDAAGSSWCIHGVSVEHQIIIHGNAHIFVCRHQKK